MVGRIITTGLAFVVLLSLMTVPAVAPIKGVSTHTIQAVATTAALDGTQGEMTRGTTDLSRYQQTQAIYERSAERRITESSNPEEAYETRVNYIRSSSGPSTDRYDNEEVRDTLKLGTANIKGEALSETIDTAHEVEDIDEYDISSVDSADIARTNPATTSGGVERAYIRGDSSEVRLVQKGDQVFLATEVSNGEQVYSYAVDFEDGQSIPLDPSKYRGKEPLEALETACSDLTADEWAEAKDQFEGIIKAEYGIDDETYERANKAFTCAALEQKRNE